MSLLFQSLQQINFIPAGVVNFGNKSLSCSKRFLAFSSYTTMYVYDQTNFRLVRIFTTSNSIIRTIQFSKKNDNFIAIATTDYVIIYDIVMNDQVSYIYTPHFFCTMCWTPNDSIVVGFSVNYDILFFFNSKIENYNQYYSNKIDINEQLYDPNHAYFNFNMPPPENIKNEEKIHRIQLLFYDTYVATSIIFKQKTIFVLGCEGSQIARIDFESVKFDFFKAGSDCGKIKGIDYDPFNPTNCLTIWSNGVIILLDLSADQMIEIHRVTLNMSLSSAIFLSSPPGHFLTGNESNGVVQLYSSTSNEPIEKISIGNCGIRYMERASSSIKWLKDSVVLNFIDGSIIVYDFYKKQKVWQSYSGHTNTVFDVKLLPSNSDVLVSLGAEGSVCTWNIDDVTPIDRFVDEKDRFICMTITHGSGYVICGCQSGSIVVFSVKMLKILYKKKIFDNGSRVRSIDSSPHQRNLILISSEDGRIFLFDVEKREVAWKPSNESIMIRNNLLKNGDDDEDDEDPTINKKKKKANQQNDKTVKFHGVAFSPHKDKTFASACSTGILFVNQDSSLYSLYSDDKFDLASVVWSPHKDNIVLTTSDSGRVTLWELLENKTCKTKVITNHNGKSRGIAFHPTIDCIAASSGYDGCIHLFNTKTFEVYCQVSGHSEPTYGLTFSPINPYLLVSSAADTSIRVWSFDKLFQSTDEYLSSIFSKDTQKVQIRPLEGYQELIGLLIRLDKDNHQINDTEDDNNGKNSVTFKEGFIPHINDCIRIVKRRIRRMLSAAPRETSMIKKAIKSKERMLSAARLALMTGNQKKYCELLFAAGEYDKALAAAPSVSYEFWKNLMKERVKLFEEENDIVNSQIIMGEPSEAIKIILNESDKANNNKIKNVDQDYSNAMLIAASQSFSDTTFKVVQSKSSKAKELAKKNDDENDVKYCDLVFDNNQRLYEYSVASKASMFYLDKGKVFRAASCFLAVGDLKSAINSLERNGELMIATFIANKFNLMNKRMAIKLMRINPSFVWKNLPPELQSFTFPLLSIEDQQQNIDHERKKNKNEENIANKMHNLLIDVNQNIDEEDSHSKLKKVVSIGISYLTETLKNKAWDFADVKDVLNVFELINNDFISEKNLTLLNAIEFYVASFDALWKGFNKIVKKMIDVGEFLAAKVKSDNEWICDLYRNLKESLKTFNCKEMCKIVPVGYDLIGTSYITLQDSSSHSEKISIQELLMWQEVTSFSPTGSCDRIYYV